MENVFKTIEKNRMFKKGDRVAVACSGGEDSMSLLHFLWTNREMFGIEVCVVNVDHTIRETSAYDSHFVNSYCIKNNIKCYSFKVNAKQFSIDKKLTLEQGARECRFRIFRNLVNKNLVDKIALAHHMQDQAETILLNIFRGTGLHGASGIDYVRDDIYIRPLLNTTKAEIKAYIETNDIPYVYDETNEDNDYNRNYIRNKIMPLIRFRWQNVDAQIARFGDTCRSDDEYVNSLIPDNAMIVEEGIVRIYSNYFVYHDAYVYRLIMKALKAIGHSYDIEKKHLSIIKGVGLDGENGTKVNLPNGLTIIKEYNFVTITNRTIKPNNKHYEFKRGKIDVSNFGLIETFLLKNFQVGDYTHVIDSAKLPKGVEWRFRKDGDVFEKFGGGSKSLSDYLIDKKIPVRLRNNTPVLAVGNEILVIAGVEISDKVKIDKKTKTAYGINVVRF